MDLRNKKVIVVGLGESGFDACVLLQKNGAIVYATDDFASEKVKRFSEALKKKFLIDVEIGSHDAKNFIGTDLVVVSPGIPPDNAVIKWAEENKVKIISELELGFLLSKGRFIAITGTNGKSTVTSLVGLILKKSGIKTIVCGNIGNSLSGEADKTSDETICVVEVSSYQLERIQDFRPQIACILNVTEDHLDRYTGFIDYAAAKMNINKNQTRDDILIINDEDIFLNTYKFTTPATILRYSVEYETDGFFIKNKEVWFKKKDLKKKIFDLNTTNIAGRHNVENLMAAISIAESLGIENGVVEESIKEYKPLPHRMQIVGKIKGVTFIDDSKATNVDAAKRAIEAVDGELILIAGGQSKNCSFLKLKKTIEKKVKTIMAIGESKDQIRTEIEGKVKVLVCDKLEEAVEKAYAIAKKNQTILLAPMCSSFDMFRDYAHRGEVFQRAVKKLGKG